VQRVCHYQSLALFYCWAQADNGGGALIGSNYPYKGGKTNFYEGGIRAAAFVYSELLPPAVRGVPITGPVHVSRLLIPFRLSCCNRERCVCSLFVA
jgi:hypothetical protein